MRTEFKNLQGPLGDVSLVDGQLVYNVPPSLRETLEAVMVVEPSTFARLTPATPERWLRALPYTFRSAYLMAAYSA